MKRSTLILLKSLTWLACLWQLIVLVYEAATNSLGPDPTAKIELSTGYTTLLLLIVSLAITPVRRLVPRLSWLIKFRRLLGLFAFFYATLHLLTYVALYAGFDVNTMLTDIAKRRFITMGLAAWLLLLPLAATSTTWAIRKLGGKRWNQLHKLVYLAAVCGSHSLLVAGQAGRAEPPAPHDRSRDPAPSAPDSRLHPAPQESRYSVSGSRTTSSSPKSSIRCATGLKLFLCSGVGPSRASASRCSREQ
jgi:sulfoxide reductase heme-binding subunit YedZ